MCLKTLNRSVIQSYIYIYIYLTLKRLPHTFDIYVKIVDFHGFEKKKTSLTSYQNGSFIRKKKFVLTTFSPFYKKLEKKYDHNVQNCVFLVHFGRCSVDKST